MRAIFLSARRFARLAVAAIFGLTVTVVLVFGQAPATKTAPASNPATAYATGPLDPEAASLPRGFMGTSCGVLVSALKKLPLAKSQYEKSDAYEERLAGLHPIRVSASLALDDLVAFRFPTDMTVNYDADKEQVSVELPWGSMAFPENPAKDEMDIQSYKIVGRDNTTSSSYVGSNAFGAKRTITRVRGSACAVVYSYCGGAVPLEFSMTPQDGRAMGNRPAVLIVGRLRPPYYRLYRAVDEPKLDSPIDRDILLDGVRLQPTAFWFYSASTGRVYAKVPVSEECGR